MGTDDVESIIREYLSKRTPDGYYVIPVKNEARRLLERYHDIVLEESGLLLFVKTKSRSTAEKILRKLYHRRLLGER